MNPWWLLLIVPVSAGIGFVVASAFFVASCNSCKEAMRYRDALINEKISSLSTVS